MAVIGLLKMVQRPSQQAMKIEFATQSSQLAARSAIEDSLGDAERAPKPGHDSADRRNLHLCWPRPPPNTPTLSPVSASRVSSFVNGNARALKLDRVELALFEELFQTALRFRT